MHHCWCLFLVTVQRHVKCCENTRVCLDYTVKCKLLLICIRFKFSNFQILALKPFLCNNFIINMFYCFNFGRLNDIHENSQNIREPIFKGFKFFLCYRIAVMPWLIYIYASIMTSNQLDCGKDKTDIFDNWKKCRCLAAWRKWPNRLSPPFVRSCHFFSGMVTYYFFMPENIKITSLLIVIKIIIMFCIFSCSKMAKL